MININQEVNYGSKINGKTMLKNMIGKTEKSIEEWIKIVKEKDFFNMGKQ